MTTRSSAPQEVDELDETIQDLEHRGFEPVLVVFRDSSGEVEVLTRGGVDLASFAWWLATVWVHASRDRHVDRGH